VGEEQKIIRIVLVVGSIGMSLTTAYLGGYLAAITLGYFALFILFMKEKNIVANATALFA
jgi:pimeloyl-CoA synthetase